MTRRRDLLRTLETVLLVSGLTLLGWCGSVLLEARYVNSLPLPHTSSVAYAASAPAAPAAAPASNTLPPVPQGTIIAKFEAPTVHLTATVLEGTADSVLAKGAGHIEGTAVPGAAGNVGIAGHRDTTFRAVRNLKVGDPILLRTNKGTFEYRITKTMIVNPDAVWVLDPTDHPVLTLVTCYPFYYVGHAPKRYVVKADMIGNR